MRWKMKKGLAPKSNFNPQTQTLRSNFPIKMIGFTLTFNFSYVISTYTKHWQIAMTKSHKLTWCMEQPIKIRFWRRLAENLSFGLVRCAHNPMRRARSKQYGDVRPNASRQPCALRPSSYAPRLNLTHSSGLSNPVFVLPQFNLASLMFVGAN